ncbi:monovalent cation/H+ antiporter complex subunit F [Streptomyces sp. NPDC001514]
MTTAWLAAAVVLLPLGLAPCLWVSGRGAPHERLAGLSLATTTVIVLLVLIAQGFGRTGYTDMALVLAVLGPVGTLVFARFLGAAGKS